MLEIFHAPRTRSMRILWLAEEMGLSYTLHPETIGRPSADLLAINPSGKIPTIRDKARSWRSRPRSCIT